MGSCSIGSLCSLGHQKRWKAAGSSEAGLLGSGRRSGKSCTKRSSGTTCERVRGRCCALIPSFNPESRHGSSWRNQCTGKDGLRGLFQQQHAMLDTKYGPAGRSAEDKPAWPGARFRFLACGGGLEQSVAPLINFTPYASTEDRCISKQHFRESF